MTDLLLGILVIGLLSAMLFVASLRASRTLRPRVCNLLAILMVALIVGFIVHVQGSIRLSHILPFSNLIVVSNWQPLLVSVLAGLLWYRLPGGIWRRCGVSLALVGACLFTIYKPILAQPPLLSDEWEDNVCLQTSPASCSPAAAATLLRAYGIDASEAEMALLCLTSRSGTPMQGLYRGLKLKTRGTAWDVYMFDRATIADLRGAGPALLSVELRGRAQQSGLQAWGWIPGVPHSVVLLGFVGDDRVLIADPAVGREVWFIDDLRLLWHGEGIRLVPGRTR